MEKEKVEKVITNIIRKGVINQITEFEKDFYSPNVEKGEIDGLWESLIDGKL